MSKWLRKKVIKEVVLEGRKLGLSDTISCILGNRGILGEENIHKFLYPKLRDMHDPLLMEDMDEGTDIVIEAMNKGLKIVVYGDYDADGVTSTAIMYGAIKEVYENVIYYLPNREEEGYGLNGNRIKKLKSEGVDLILTCDNGISAINEIELAKSLEMQVVVTDHHEVQVSEEKEEILPTADAIINPKKSSCAYPFKMLCGAGVALKFTEILYKKLKKSYDFNRYIELCAIGTVCDVVDLIDENRTIVKLGLSELNKTRNMGLKALIKECGLEGKIIKSYHLGFVIGPCINATGRLKTADISLKLLFSKTEKEAEDLAKELRDLNETRQHMTEENVERLIESVEGSSLKKDKVLVLYDEEVHESIAGIVAGRLKERYNLPSFVLTKASEGVKGSGRSIEEYNMFKELLKCKDLMDKFGGHPMAAGLSLKEENVKLLRKMLNENCTLTEEDIEKKIIVDKIIKIRDIDRELIKALETLEPFGKGNSSPLFALTSLDVCRISILGKNKSVLKFTFRTEGIYIDGIAFKEAENFTRRLEEEYGDEASNLMVNPKGLKLDIIFYPSINEYNGKSSIELNIKDYRINK